MEKVSLLKGKKNSFNQTRFIAEQIPEGIVETKKLVSKKAANAKKLEEKKPMAERRPVQIIADKVLVGVKYSRMISLLHNLMNFFLVTMSRRKSTRLIIKSKKPIPSTPGIALLWASP